VKHYQIQFQPDNLTTLIHKGATLLEAAGQVGIILSTPCGSAGRCGKCKVRLLPSEKEVLACQYIIDGDLTVLVPESSRFYQQQILEHGIDRKVAATASIRKVFIENPHPQSQGFRDSLSAAVSAEVCVPDSLLKDLSNLSLHEEEGVTAVLFHPYNDNEPSSRPRYILKAVENGDTTEKLLGLAIDIGTTTVVARLVDLQSGQVCSTASAGNPQTQYGADVVSRISYCEHDKGLDKLHASIIGCLNGLIEKVRLQSSVETKDIYEVVFAGNTTMTHLLLKYPVQQLGQAPYRAYSLDACDRGPADLGLQINPAGNIHVLANIAGFVGSDTVAASLACGLDITTANTLLIDIGTNGEIVYGSQSNLLAASCAAGPALEGAGITFGSRAQSGAIERVLFDGKDIDVDVIGTGQARTICGSGLIDAVAVILNLGMIDTTGRFFERSDLSPLLPDPIRRRLITHTNEPAFVLAGTYLNKQWKNAVFLSQKDVRQLQLAKAAIRAGIELLLKKAHTDTSSIQQILLAGAFGNYIQKENAVRIGLLPSAPLEKIHFVGNSAGTGARMTLISRGARKLADRLAKQINYVEIAHEAEFQMVFSEYLMFPEK
jgi:uncharacterized 2Fe-2S/4Fe-4S cluster protein (DUF4445 family)